MFNKLRDSLEGYKTYIVLLFWLIAEVVNFGGYLPVDIVAIRAAVLPLLGLTVNAKLERKL